jgi:DNA replication protein DnaD
MINDDDQAPLHGPAAPNAPFADVPVTARRVQAKFGVVADAGFQAVPDVLLLHQAELNLRSEDLNVLLQITTHWYVPEKMPFPWTSTIAKRMGVSTRSVQRSLRRLVKLKLIGKVRREDRKIAYDLKPLVTKLEPLARRRLELRSKLRGQTAA